MPCTLSLTKRHLMWLSAVEVSPLSEKIDDEELAPLVSTENVSDNIEDINNKIKKSPAPCRG